MLSRSMMIQALCVFSLGAACADAPTTSEVDLNVDMRSTTAALDGAAPAFATTYADVSVRLDAMDQAYFVDLATHTPTTIEALAAFADCVGGLHDVLLTETDGVQVVAVTTTLNCGKQVQDHVAGDRIDDVALQAGSLRERDGEASVERHQLVTRFDFVTSAVLDVVVLDPTASE